MENLRATVVGIFDDREQARQAVAALRDAGFRESEWGWRADIETHTPGDIRVPVREEQVTAEKREVAQSGCAGQSQASSAEPRETIHPAEDHDRR